MDKARSVYRKKRKFYGNKFHRNKRLSEEAILEDESCMQKYSVKCLCYWESLQPGRRGRVKMQFYSVSGRSFSITAIYP